LEFDGIARGLRLVDRAILRAVEGDERTLTGISKYVVGSGGKRIRPALVLLSYLAANGASIRRAVPAAAAVEVIHTATLIHDDISDRSERRRGKPSAHVNFGVARSLIAADYLMTAAFKLVSAYGVDFISTINSACMNMAIGEIQDLRNTANPRLSREEYLEIIGRKTGALFEAGVKVGVMAAGAPQAQVRAFGRYGREVGAAFQIIDDMLDVSAKARALGKPVGGDLREGKVTLPTIYALEHTRGRDHAFLERVVSARRGPPTGGEISRAIKIVRATGAEPYCRKVAAQHTERAKRALARVPPSKARSDLVAFADDLVQRRR
jgi:geranylgeranyl pyrophosphate synthase